MLKRLAKGQTVIEYTALIIIVAGAFLLTSIYLKRAIQGRWKDTVDQFGEQYDPTAMNTDIQYQISTNAFSNMVIVPAVGGFWTNKVDSINTYETKTGYMGVTNY